MHMLTLTNVASCNDSNSHFRHKEKCRQKSPPTCSYMSMALSYCSTCAAYCATFSRHLFAALKMHAHKQNKNKNVFTVPFMSKHDK